MLHRHFIYRLTAAILLASCSLLVFAVGPVVIDVRTSEEYAQRHINDALNLPYDTISVRIAVAVPDKNTPIVLYCRSGRRAETALHVLKGMGYSKVENYGGLDEAQQRLGAR
ncbi:MAG: rhodanese-like domain-containing protein [Betaproteobacteria bacterium]|nr:rhodanese-like domain-containing protein [Betaproteobacteria bacterium]